MAYFSNGSEGMVFDEQCSKCAFGEDACPIAMIQFNYNYEACNNKVARKIMDDLVKDNGECSMWKAFGDRFKGTDKFEDAKKGQGQLI